MALKEKALKRLCAKLDKVPVDYLLTGPWMLSIRGLSAAWHGFDVYVPRSQYATVDEALSRLGMREAVEETASFAETHYHFDGADIALHAGFPLPEGEDYTPGEAPFRVTVLGQAVPVMRPEDWYLICRLTGRTPDPVLSDHFAGQGFDMTRLSAFSGPADLSSLVPQP